jgi:hypothetical protein
MYHLATYLFEFILVVKGRPVKCRNRGVGLGEAGRLGGGNQSLRASEVRASAKAKG